MTSSSSKMDHHLSPPSDVLIFGASDNLEPEPFIDDGSSCPSDHRQLIDSHKEQDEECSERGPPPRDRYHLVYIVSYLLGTSTLLPWYFFITCTEYWMYRFRDPSNDTTVLFSYAPSLPGRLDSRDKLQADFMSYLSIASTIPSTAFLFANLFFLKKYSINGRVILAFALLLTLFVETTILVLFDTDKWQWYFFIITLTTVVLLNIATALLQAALCAIITRFPVSYISAFSSGQSVAGILAAILRVLSLYLSVDSTKSTFMYFTFADVIILTAFCCYCGFRKTEFYKFYSSLNAESRHHRLNDDNAISSTVDYRDLQMRIIYPCGALFLCFIITTSVYPSIAGLVVSYGSHLDKYFVPVITYLLYSICEYSGRVFAGLIQKPKGKYAFWFSFSRIFLIPLLMLCNAQPRFHLKVLFESDLIYAIIVIVLGLTNGYLANLSFVLMHRSVYCNEHEAASNILVIWLASGLSAGSLISFPLVNLL